MRTARQPASAIPPLIFPVALLLLNSGGLKASTELPGVPDRLVLRVRARRSVHPGRAVLDDERRDRPRARHPDRVLLATLVDARSRLCAARGQITGIVVLGIVQAVFYISVGLLLGVRFASGPAGIPLLLVYAALVAVGFGALGSFLALRTGSGESIQGLFPVLFVFLFISSMNTPAI